MNAKRILIALSLIWLSFCAWQAVHADTVSLVNQNAANLTYSIGGTQYRIASDGTVSANINDAGAFYLNGFQQVGASPGASPLTTKGDLFGYSTTNARLPVGTNGQLLSADSTQTLGIKWITGGVSYPLLAPSGSTAAPSYSFSSDSSAGFRYATSSGNPYVWGSEGSSDVFRFSGAASRFDVLPGIALYYGGLPLFVDPVISVPIDAGSVDITNVSFHAVRIINPAGTLSTLTVVLEDGGVAGETLRVTFTQIITTLTISGNTSASGLANPSTAAVGSSFLWVWSNATNKWVRTQ